MTNKTSKALTGKTSGLPTSANATAPERGSGANGIGELPIGHVLGPYRIEAVLGAGGFGITYRARHEALGKLFAIKEHFPRQFAIRDGNSVRATAESAATYQWVLDRFVEEARLIARFKHASIVGVADVFKANGTAYMALDYEPGVTLLNWMETLGRRPDQADLDRILAPLLEALAIVHAGGVLHRDISPDNILIRPDGSPVLLDFGAAREALRQKTGGVSAIVKPGYSPPEQYTSEAAQQGPWTDIYALGATLFHLLSGDRPLDAPSRLLNDKLAALQSSAMAGYRQSFLAAIDAALRLKPEARPRTVAAWRATLLAGPGTAAVRATVGEPATRKRTSRGGPVSRAEKPVSQRVQAPAGLLPPAPPPRRWPLRAVSSRGL